MYSDSSDELCYSGFLQVQADRLITQVKARAGKGMKTVVKIQHLWMTEIIFTLQLIAAQCLRLIPQ